MTDRQRNKYNMYQTVQQTCQDYEATWSPVPAAVTLKATFDALLADVETTLIAQERDTTGVTADKQALEDTLETQGAIVAGILKAYAHATGNGTLAAEAGYPPSRFQLASDATLLAMAQGLVQAATTHLADAQDYGLTQQHIDDLTATADAFGATFAAPRDAITDRATATQKLNRLLGDLDTLLYDQADPLFYQYVGTDFHTAYQNARQIIDLGS